MTCQVHKKCAWLAKNIHTDVKTGGPIGLIVFDLECTVLMVTY